MRRPTARAVSRIGHAVALGIGAFVAWQTYDLMSSCGRAPCDPHGYAIVFGAIFLLILLPILALGILGYARAWPRGRSVPLELFDVSTLLLTAIFLQSAVESMVQPGPRDLSYLPGVAVTVLYMALLVGAFVAGRRAASSPG